MKPLNTCGMTGLPFAGAGAWATSSILTSPHFPASFRQLYLLNRMKLVKPANRTSDIPSFNNMLKGAPMKPITGAP
jgi:hypothetical protein